MEEPLPPTPLDKKRRFREMKLKIQELKSLIKRLSGLPYEIRLQILLDMDYGQLLQICKFASKEEAEDWLVELGNYCDDAPFWQDYLIAQGFFLSDNFPQVINAIRGKGESEANVIKNFFFGDEDKQTLILERVKNQWNKAVKQHPNLKGSSVAQLVLDIDYLLHQADVYQTRKDSDEPFVFKSYYQIEDDLPESDLLETLANIAKFTYPELLQILVDHDAKPVFHETFSWLNDVNGINNLKDQLAEQTYALTDDLLREGDIIKLILVKLNDRNMFKFVEEHYFYFNGKNLYPLSGEVSVELYLPTFAVPFLIQKQVHTLSDLENLYPAMKIVKLKGFESPIDGKKIKLTSSSKGKPLKIQNHTFYTK